MLPISTAGGVINPKMQTISVIKPIVGEILYINVNGQRYPMTVQSVDMAGEYVIGAKVKLGDNISEIKLSPEFVWIVPGYNISHSIELNF